MGNGLAAAGMISGMGQNLNQGFQTLNSGIVQWGLQQSLAKNDREFQLEKMDRQQKFERELLGTKMAADKENSLAQIEATGKNTQALENLRAGHAKELEGMKEGAADARLDKTLDADMAKTVLNLGVTKEIKDKDREMLSNRYKEMYSIQERQLAQQKGAVHTITTGDGRIALMSPTGKSLGYLKDSEGKEIKTAADIPKSVIEQGNDIVDQMKDLTREYTKNQYHSEEDKDAYNSAKKDLQRQLDTIYAPYSGKSVTPPAPTKLNLGKYSTTPGQGTVLAPAPASAVGTPPATAGTPPGVTKAPGLTGAVKGIVPGLGMLQNYLQK